MLAGKRCNPFLVYIALAVIVIALALLVMDPHANGNPPPEKAPMHDPR